VRHLGAIAEASPDAAASAAVNLLTHPAVRFGKDEPEVIEVIEKLTAFSSLAGELSSLATFDADYYAALGRGALWAAVDVCERALLCAPDAQQEQRILAMACMPLDHLGAWSKVAQLVDRLLIQHVRRQILHPSVGIELLLSLGPRCALRALRPGADPHIAVTLGNWPR
jgi:hypothetical protein